MSRKYLGLDCSTQSLTAVVIDIDSSKICQEIAVNFGEELPSFNSPQGILPSDDPLLKHSNPLMWLAALELMFNKLGCTGVNLSEIEGICGSAQQHGTVYLKPGFLKPDWLKADSTLEDCIAPLLSRPTSPIWMDSTTFEECRYLDAAFGNGKILRQRSGSNATERFAGPQICRFARQQPDAYNETGVIHLVSSFMCSALIGESAPLDYGDASGMNLMDLKTWSWDPEFVETTAPNLMSKLPNLVPSTTIVGRLHPYFEQYGFRAGVPIVAWSGDNPNSLIGVGGWKAGSAVISLGTSDTYFAAMDKIAVDPQGYGHVFGNPAGGYMSLICFKNGSFAREIIKEQFGLTWKEFDNYAFDMTVPGNGGCMMLPYFTSEITPLVLNVGPIYEGNSLFKAHKDASTTVRALVEAQALSMRLHSSWIGSSPKKLRLTGGASKSDGMSQVFADVFNATVERLQVSDSAALGASMRCAQACSELEWGRLTKMFCACDSHKTVKPKEDNVAVYNELLPRFAALEASIT